MGMSIKTIVGTAISLLVIALIVPLAIGTLSAAGDFNVTVNGVPTPFSELADPAIVTLLTILLPIVAVVGLILAFVPSKGD